MTALRLHRALDPLFRTPPGIGRLAAVNHSDIGLRFLATAFAFFLIGGILAMLIRAQLATPDSAFLDAARYNQIFTMHGTVMMFLFAIPAIEGLALYFLPKLLGARDLAFPRLSAYGYWCNLFGGTILIVALLAGVAPDSGWFMYTPLSSRPYSPGINADVWLLGITFVEISGLAAAIEIAVTVLKVRAPGMSLARMPLLGWYLLVTAGMIILGFPPLILGSVLLELERALGWPFFDPQRGGDPLLWQHLFWLFGHPEVYIIFLPAAGIISTVLPAMVRAPILGYGWIVAAAIGLGFLSFGLWVHHMFTTGIPHLGLAFFSAASTLVVVPTAIQIFAWIGTIASGRPRLRLPMLYIFGFFAVFVLGGLTGVMIAIVPFDWQAHDTHFIVAHLHYVLVGGFVLPLIAGAYYWLPLISGRRRVYKLGETAFWMILGGFNLTFLQMHLTGLLGMPRRVATYPPAAEWTLLNLLSSIGGFLSAIGFAMVAIDFALQFLSGRKPRRNPWAAGTLEWAMTTPPMSYNFASLPRVTGREPLAERPDLTVALARGEGYLGRRRGDWRETLCVDMVSGRTDHILLLPGPTYLPLAAGIATGAAVLGLLFKAYPVTLAGLVAMLVVFWRWGWAGGLRRDEGPVPIGCGESAPPHPEAAGAPGWWGSVFTLAANGAFFGSLLFGHAFLWTVAPDWPPPALVRPHAPSAAIGLAGLALGWWLAAAAARRTAADGVTAGGRALLLGAATAQLLAAAAILIVPLFRAPAATSHAYAAVSHALAAYAILHCLIAAILTVFAWARAGAGFVSARRTLELRIARQWQGWSLGAGAIVLGLLHGVPVLAG